MDKFTLEAQHDEPRTTQADIEPGTLDLRCCDCMQLMAEFPDKHFDLAIVDPPYGIGFDGDSTLGNNPS
ncbi:MAG TPA: hypothetical protein VLA24_11285, partial [Pseudomonadales bacterium]|nr:hypothetical protein [Pseudomonadales bacterium]